MCSSSQQKQFAIKRPKEKKYMHLIDSSGLGNTGCSELQGIVLVRIDENLKIP